MEQRSYRGACDSCKRVTIVEDVESPARWLTMCARCAERHEETVGPLMPR